MLLFLLLFMGFLQGELLLELFLLTDKFIAELHLLAELPEAEVLEAGVCSLTWKEVVLRFIAESATLNQTGLLERAATASSLELERRLDWHLRVSAVFESIVFVPVIGGFKAFVLSLGLL